MKRKTSSRDDDDDDHDYIEDGEGVNKERFPTESSTKESEDIVQSSLSDTDDGREIEVYMQTYGAFARHFDPFTHGPEHLQESRKLQFKKSLSTQNVKQSSGSNSIENLKFSSRKVYKNGHIEHITYGQIHPRSPITELENAVDTTLEAFLKLSMDSSKKYPRYALLEDPSTRNVLGDKSFLCSFFFQTLTKFSFEFVNKVIQHKALHFSLQDIQEMQKFTKSLGRVGGTYTALILNNHGNVTGTYAGRSQHLTNRFRDHQTNLAITLNTCESAHHIESYFYQRISLEVQKGGKILFIPTNIFPTQSQESNTLCAVFEAVLSFILCTYQMNKDFLYFRAETGLPSVCFLGLNSTPCMEPPDRFSRLTEKAANPTLAPIVAELRNIYMNYGSLCSSIHQSENKVLQEKEETVREEYEQQHAVYMQEVARLLRSGTYKLRIVREKRKNPSMPYYQWKTTNLGGRTLPRDEVTKILKAANVRNDSQEPLLISVQLVLGDPRASDDLFIGTSQAYHQIYGGMKLYMKSLDVHLQFQSILHRTMERERKYTVDGKKLNEVPMLRKSNLSQYKRSLLEKHEKAFFDLSMEDKDAAELLLGDLPVSIQGKNLVAFLNDGSKIRFPFTQSFREQLSRNSTKEEFYFAKLQFCSAEPLWEGGGFPSDIEEPLRDVGLSLFSNSLQMWWPVSANVRMRKTVPTFTLIASRAANSARRLPGFIKYQSNDNARSEPETEEDGDDPAFRVFNRTVPSLSCRKIGVLGRKEPTISIPLRLLRMWFPDLRYPKGQQISVKIDGKNATKAGDVRIFLRLDSEGVGHNVGVWYNVLRYAKNRAPSTAIWQYIQQQQSATQFT